MPLGKDLKTQVASCLHLEIDSFGRPIADRAIREAITEHVEAVGDWRKDLSPYSKAFEIIRRGAPHAASIDNLLSAHESNEMVKLFGKMAICKCILEAERHSQIYCSSGTELSNKMEETWFLDIFRMLCADVSSDNLRRIFHGVSFINYNYDRCIQQYLCKAIQEYYNIDSARALELVDELTVIYPYGHIGKLAESGNNLHFGGEANGKKLIEISSGIKTFSEQIKYASDKIRIRNTLSKADIIVFLGFHFHKQNIELLEINELVMRDRRIFFTALGSSEGDRKYIISKIQSTFNISADAIMSHDGSCHSLMQSYGRALQA